MSTIQIFKNFLQNKLKTLDKNILTQFRRIYPGPYPLSTSKDRGFRCFERVEEVKSSLKSVKNNIKDKCSFLKYLK